MGDSYQEFLTSLNDTGNGQDFIKYAQNANVPVVYNPELNRLLVNNMPVNMANTGLSNQSGKLYGSEESYQQLLAPFLNNQQQVSSQINNFQPYQTPDYINQFMQEMTQKQQQPFTYNFEDDPSVANARQQLESSISEMAGSRGFLYGSAQSDLVQQEVGKLMPQFEQAAYAREQDFLSRQISLAGVIMQWDQMQADRRMDDMQLLQTKADFMLKLETRELDVFKTMLDQRRFEMELLLEQQKFDMEKQETEFQLAWARVDALGYADNETALTLGIPVGTKASWIKKMIAEQEATLEKMKQQHSYNLEMLQVNKEIETELMIERDKLSVESSLRLMEQEYLYTTALAEQNEVFRREIEAKEAEEAAAAAAAAEAEAAAAAKQAAVDKEFDTQMSVEYNLAKARLKASFVVKGVVTGDNRVKAINWLHEQLKNEEITISTYNRLAAEYGLPEYQRSFSTPAVQSYVQDPNSKYNAAAAMTYNTVSQTLGRWR